MMHDTENGVGRKGKGKREGGERVLSLSGPSASPKLKGLLLLFNTCDLRDAEDPSARLDQLLLV